MSDRAIKEFVMSNWFYVACWVPLLMVVLPNLIAGAEVVPQVFAWIDLGVLAAWMVARIVWRHWDDV